MAKSLYEMFDGNQNGGFSIFNNPQINQQFTSFVQGLDSNVRNYPYQMVQNLINSGRMSPAQFEQFRQFANQATGKNY